MFVVKHEKSTRNTHGKKHFKYQNTFEYSQNSEPIEEKK